jgi:2'-hydroxyisoflavone reductase
VNPLNILIIGGAGFAGSHQVHAAVSRGHKVAVLSRRGKREVASVPSSVEELVGDRFGELDEIKGRIWDAVIDFAAFAPLGVRMLGEQLGGQIKHYTLVSTVMTYSRTGFEVDELSPVLEFDGTADPFTLQMPKGWRQYGSLKVLCEREAERQFPGRTLIARPSVISGPGDGVDHIAYWFARMQKGGEILAPGNPLAPIQFIDARDLAEWLIRMVESNETGTYNAAGPMMTMTMCELLGAVRSLFSTPLQLTWVSSQWLTEQKVTADQAPFFWVRDPQSAQPDELWLSYRVSSAKAHAKGLAYRPLSSTLADNLSWFRSLPEERQASPRSGWTEKYERELLMSWREHCQKGGHNGE